MINGFSITFDYFSITLLLGGFTALLSGIVVFIHNRRKSENIAWLLSNLASALWSFGYFAMINSTTRDYALWSNWVLHVASVCVPIFYLYSALYITGAYERFKKYAFSFSFIGLIFLGLVPTTWFVRDVLPKAHFNFVCDAGPIYIYFTLYFFIVVLFTLFVLFQKIKNEQDLVQKQKNIYIIIFTIFGFAGGGSVFFLTFNIPILPYPLILFALYPAVSGYAIFRYQLFNVKVIATEILVFIVWLSFLFRIVTTNDVTERIINVSLLVFMLVSGIFLIRSVIKEVQLREKVEKLAEDLEEVNANLAMANEKLKEVDQLKSEFLSLATHQIRAPLTAIKGYASLILEGDYGKLTPDAHGAVQVIFNSCQNLVVIVSEFLDISRIEQGRMKYDLVKFDISKLISEIISELKPTIEKTGLTMNFESENIPSMVYADLGKIKQVLGNIIDNSMKYTPKGGIRISIEEEVNKTKISISDTGIGVAPEDISKLFTKFTRAKDAFRTNVIGTGLGLYVAKQMIEAQNGKVWVESPGLGKGSTFCIELPKE